MKNILPSVWWWSLYRIQLGLQKGKFCLFTGLVLVSAILCVHSEKIILAGETQEQLIFVICIMWFYVLFVTEEFESWILGDLIFSFRLDHCKTCYLTRTLPLNFKGNKELLLLWIKTHLFVDSLIMLLSWLMGTDIFTIF